MNENNDVSIPQQQLEEVTKADHSPTEVVDRNVPDTYSSPTIDQLQQDIRKRGPSIPAIASVPTDCTIPDNHWRHPDSKKLIPSISEAEEAVVTLLRYIGEDPDRDGLKETPQRVVKALREMTVGYHSKPEGILSKVFEQHCDEVIVVRGIPFISLCEHHILPYGGTVDIGYLPGKSSSWKRLPPSDSYTTGNYATVGNKVVGLSKLARLVDLYARRLTIQERLTQQIAYDIENILRAQGVGVVVKAEHSCMSCRGVSKTGCEMVTSCMLGVFRSKSEARAELLDLFRR